MPFLPLLPLLARAVAAWLTDTLAPPACAACDARLGREAIFCPGCAHGVVPVGRRGAEEAGAEGPGGGALPIVAFALFGGPVAEALKRFKYKGRGDLARPLGHLARRAAREAKLVADVVVPVPLHPARLAERGYNQAALLGAEVARELGAPLLARGLGRTRNTAHQARLDRASRRGNVEGAFRVRAAEGVRGKRVVLVDDVATTGATLAACSAALLAAGARSVTAVVVARTEMGGGEEG